MGNLFRDRIDAGRQLAKALSRFAGEQPVVLALPRGGVQIGFEIADALDAPLDILIVRKIGAPDQPELALGALVDGGAPEVLIDEELTTRMGITRAVLERQIERTQEELRRREVLYRGHRPWIPLANRTVIVADDGIATGSTMRAALRRLRKESPKQLIMAVPVAPPDTLVELRPLADLIVCLQEPQAFRAVGLFYESFDQVPDREVIDVLERARRREPRREGGMGGPGKG